MQIINDRSITVSTGSGRKCTNWQPAVMTLGELYDRLHTPIRGEETLAAYMQMSKTERDNRKDIGGFVGGQLAGRRKKANVQGRDLVTLDLDNLPPGVGGQRQSGPVLVPRESVRDHRRSQSGRRTQPAQQPPCL